MGTNAPPPAAPVAPVEVERSNFVPLLLQNPNYFGNIEGSKLKPVKPIKFNTTYEELHCVGLNPPYDRLEAVLDIKKEAGYSGDICTNGSGEYVRFYVDLHNNGVFHDVGIASVRVHDIPGQKPLSYAVYLDFNAIRSLCIFENIVKVRAILSWNVAPPANTPNYVPVWGNRLDVKVQIHPAPFLVLGDLLKQFEEVKVKIPDPIGPVIDVLDPLTKLPQKEPLQLSIAAKKRMYAGKEIPAHRFAFAEVSKLMESPAISPQSLTLATASPLELMGLDAKEISAVIGKFTLVTDGDTSYEQLHCVGLRPANDMLEAVLTLKKPSGYSGNLCSKGSTEYVAFWADFSDGTGFNYLGTATVNVHDLQHVPPEGLQYAVYRKVNLAKWRQPCEVGARVARVRAILSWETPPPPGNPNWVPVWGNRVECRVQIRPGIATGHTPLIETVGDVAVHHIDQGTGLATGDMEIAAATVNQSPFGGEVTITGIIPNPPSVLAGGAQPFKYRIEVSEAGKNNFHPLTNKIEVSYSEAVNGFPVWCALFQFTCDTTLTPTDDGDGFGDGWYPYLEDHTPAHSRHLIVDVLGRWQTAPAMEGLWEIRISAKDPNTHTLYPGIQTVKVRIDNTAPTASIAITGATFNGAAIPAADCGKFPVGAILSGTYSSHDPGTVSPAVDYQHWGSLSLDVIPDAPAHGAAPVPSSRSFAGGVLTTGEDGTWTLNTAGMDPCGYVIHMIACDRTNYNSTGNALCVTADVGFCLEEAPKNK